ncbi:MAG: DUF3306 domain-containing protein [Burkholderiaceae bacterium]
MSKQRGGKNDQGFEGFASRWSRRKSSARSKTGDIPVDHADTVDTTADVNQLLASALPADAGTDTAESVTDPRLNEELANKSDTTGESPSTSVSDTAAGQPELPSLESLNEDSDYSPFMGPNVSKEIRNLALRKLFSSPIYNITDGLDDYDEDFTTFEKLGDIVTADMRHHAQRKEALRAEAQALENKEGRENQASETEPATDPTEPSDATETADASDAQTGATTAGTTAETTVNAGSPDDAGKSADIDIDNQPYSTHANSQGRQTDGQSAANSPSTPPIHGKIRRRTDQV